MTKVYHKKLSDHFNAGKAKIYNNLGIDSLQLLKLNSSPCVQKDFDLSKFVGDPRKSVVVSSNLWDEPIRYNPSNKTKNKDLISLFEDFGSNYHMKCTKSVKRKTSHTKIVPVKAEARPNSKSGRENSKKK